MDPVLRREGHGGTRGSQKALPRHRLAHRGKNLVAAERLHRRRCTGKCYPVFRKKGLIIGQAAQLSCHEKQLWNLWRHAWLKWQAGTGPEPKDVTWKPRDELPTTTWARKILMPQADPRAGMTPDIKY